MNERTSIILTSLHSLLISYKTLIHHKRETVHPIKILTPHFLKLDQFQTKHYTARQSISSR